MARTKKSAAYPAPAPCLPGCVEHPAGTNAWGDPMGGEVACLCRAPLGQVAAKEGPGVEVSLGRVEFFDPNPEAGIRQHEIMHEIHVGASTLDRESASALGTLLLEGEQLMRVTDPAAPATPCGVPWCEGADRPGHSDHATNEVFIKPGGEATTDEPDDLRAWAAINQEDPYPVQVQLGVIHEFKGTVLVGLTLGEAEQLGAVLSDLTARAKSAA